MFQNQQSNQTNIHEITLEITYQDQNSMFDEVFQKKARSKLIKIK